MTIGLEHEIGLVTVQGENTFLVRPTSGHREYSVREKVLSRWAEWCGKYPTDPETDSIEDIRNDYKHLRLRPDLWGILTGSMTEESPGHLVFTEIVFSCNLTDIKLEKYALWTVDCLDRMKYTSEVRVYSCSGILTELYTDMDLDYLSLCDELKEISRYRVLVNKHKGLIGPMKL